MATLAPPPPSRIPDPVDPEALIDEARRRQRRRRIRLALVVAALLAAAGAGYGIARALGDGARTVASGQAPVVDASAFRGHGRLAFVSRGRLYVLDGESGKLVRVTAGGASAPVFSPDGRWLTYLLRSRVGVARSDGSDPHLLPTKLGASWLPDGRLLAGGAIYRLAAGGAPVRVGPAPVDPVAWAPDGSRWVFETMRIVHETGGAFHGVELLQVADSLTGPRTTWYRLPQRFTPASGYQTPAIAAVAVLPQRRGILVWLDPMHSASIAADGLPVYELTRPGAAPRKLGTTAGTGASVARTGRFALPGGSDRIAWVTKTALACTAARCTPVRASGPLTLDPALSPDGRTLAFVSAASEGTSVSFVPPALKRWYATRRLWVGSRAVPNSTGAAAPVWSSNGRSLLFVKDDALWLLPRLSARPVRVATPLFGTRVWPSYMGNVPWPSRFAWFSG